MSGKFDDGKQAAEAVLTLDAENVNARWVKIAALVALGENEEALAECTTLPSELVGAPDAVTLRVQLLASVDRYDEALAVADRAIAGGRVGVELALARAEVLVDAEHWDEALASLQALGADHPERPEPLRRRAYVLRRIGRDDEAIDTLSRLLSDHPTDIEALKQLAELYTERGNETAALSALDRALAVAPGRADLVLARSRVLHRTGHAVEALQSVEQALGSDPRDPEAAAFKGQILAELGRREEAAAAYLEASGRASVTKQDQAPYVAAVEAIADQLLGERKYDAALRIVESWPAALRSGDLAGLRAELWRVTGRLREAIAETDAAIAAGAEPIWMAGTKADAMVQLARSQEGLSLIEDALAENETYQFGQITRLSALNELNRVTDAMQVLDQHLSEGEGAEPYATTARSSLLINLGRFDECIRLIEQSGQVAEIAGTEAESAGTQAGAEWLSRLGAAYHRVGRFEAAIDSLRRTVELSHPDVEAWVLTELADALMRQPDSAAEARAHYERALTINTGQQRIRAALESAWALWRLGRVEPALESYRAAFDRAKDPLTFDRLRYVLLLSLVAPGPAAEAALDEILGRVAQLEDRACASGVLSDGRHVCAMLLADATWANRAERLQVAESHLQAEVTRR